MSFVLLQLEFPEVLSEHGWPVCLLMTHALDDRYYKVLRRCLDNSNATSRKIRDAEAICSVAARVGCPNKRVGVTAILQPLASQGVVSWRYRRLGMQLACERMNVRQCSWLGEIGRAHV